MAHGWRQESLASSPSGNRKTLQWFCSRDRREQDRIKSRPRLLHVNYLNISELEDVMNKVMLMAGAAMLCLGGSAIAQQAPEEVSTEPTTATSPTMAGEVATDASPDASGVAMTADGAAPATPSADPAATAQTDPAAAPAPATTAAPAATASATTPGAPDPAVAQKVQSEWATYDKEAKGSLTPLEFGTWVLAANGQDMTSQVEQSKTGKQENLAAVKVLNATAAEFAKADTNQDKAFSPDELTTYLSA